MDCMLFDRNKYKLTGSTLQQHKPSLHQGEDLHNPFPNNVLTFAETASITFATSLFIDNGRLATFWAKISE